MKDNRKKCLVCKEPMSRWFYGEPNYDALKEDILNKKIILGGCCISNHSPIWACQSCCISYKKDGSGFLDHELINHRENSDFYFEPNINSALPEITPYELPDNIKTLLENDFLEKLDNKKSIGFHFHQGGYNSAIDDVYYLDGILIYKHLKDFLDGRTYKDGTSKLPIDGFIILSKESRIKLETFITTSKWNKEYTILADDGIQWEMKRYFHSSIFRKNIKNTYGSNVFPEIYHAFLDFMDSLDVYFQRNSDDEYV